MPVVSLAQRAGRGETSGRVVNTTPYYEDDQVTLYHGDCRSFMLGVLEPNSIDTIVTDPPYGDTSLEWDKAVEGWQDRAMHLTSSMWCFGSLRYWMSNYYAFLAGWQYGQEIVWEKHNGSSFQADRFKRVHEIVVHWYQGQWRNLYRDVPVETGHRRITARRGANRTPHTGDIGEDTYDSTDRLMRSVVYVRSEHGRAVHPTQKPLGILRPLIEFSCPPGGVVLDPFAGSGSTLLAAREMGRQAIGIERDENYCRVAASRLAQGVLA